VESCLELSPDATAVSHEILAKHGNMSSPTVLFILDELRKKGASPPCVVLGFGPGLVAEVALLS
jgi:predicted naringenin-chalcone synthase